LNDGPNFFQLNVQRKLEMNRNFCRHCKMQLHSCALVHRHTNLLPGSILRVAQQQFRSWDRPRWRIRRQLSMEWGRVIPLLSRLEGLGVVSYPAGSRADPRPNWILYCV